MRINNYPCLYSFRRCPYAIRARMAIVYSQIEVELRELLLKDKPKCMLQFSPKGTVPVLVLDPQHVIDQSLEIMIWALSQNDPQHVLKNQDSAQSRLLIESNDNPFKHHLDRYKYADRYTELPLEKHRSNASKFVHELDAYLDHHPFLHGKDVSLTDVAIFPFIRQFAHVDKAWFDQQDWNNVKRWLDYWLKSKVFISAMLKYKLYNDGHHYIFPSRG